jgi:hypothetical protein
MLLPARDFGPSEASTSWTVLVNAGDVVFFETSDRCWWEWRFRR